MIDVDELIVDHYETGEGGDVNYPAGMHGSFDVVFPTAENKKLFFTSGFEPDLTKRKRLLYVILNSRREIVPGSEKMTNMYIRKTLEEKKIDCVYLNLDIPESYALYIHALMESVFVIAPSNSFNDSRLYEIWACGGIPIIEFSTYYANKYKGLPILWTTNYAEITAQYLISKRSEFVANAKFYLSYYHLLKKSYYEGKERDQQRLMLDNDDSNSSSTSSSG